MGEPLWSLLGVLFAVVAILYFTYAATKWIASRSLPGGSPAPMTGGNERLRILGQLVLGRGERLVLAQVGERCYLLGVTEQRITLLRELEGTESEEWLSQNVPAERMPGFLEVLHEFLRKK